WADSNERFELRKMTLPVFTREISKIITERTPKTNGYRYYKNYNIKPIESETKGKSSHNPPTYMNVAPIPPSNQLLNTLKTSTSSVTSEVPSLSVTSEVPSTPFTDDRIPVSSIGV